MIQGIETSVPAYAVHPEYQVWPQTEPIYLNFRHVKSNSDRGFEYQAQGAPETKERERRYLIIFAFALIESTFFPRWLSWPFTTVATPSLLPEIFRMADTLERNFTQG